MSIFIDAGIFIAYANEKDKLHAQASGLIDDIIENKHGAAFTSNMVFVDKEILNRGWNIFVKYADKKLSFTDCTTIELMKTRDIEYLASFDGGFDGIVQRLKLRIDSKS